MMQDHKKYHDIGQAFITELKLMTYPVAVRLIEPDEEEPEGAVSPRLMFGSEVPACLAYTYCRRTGASFYLT